jgi:hypothetical protein
MFVNANNIAELIYGLYFFFFFFFGGVIDCGLTLWLWTHPLTVDSPLDCGLTLWPHMTFMGKTHDVILTVDDCKLPPLLLIYGLLLIQLQYHTLAVKKNIYLAIYTRSVYLEYITCWSIEVYSDQWMLEFIIP